MNETNEKKNIFLKINWWWVSAICFGIWLILLLIFSGVSGVHAAEITGEIEQSSYVLESSYDSGILTGSDSLVLAYDKYFNPSGNPTGTLSVTYPMSAGNPSSWTGTWTRTGFARTEFFVVQGHIANLDDVTRRVYISQNNWVQTLNLKSLNKEDDSVGVLYFDSFNNQDTYGYYAIETFGVQTTDLEVYISDDIIQVQGDAALYKWNNGSWVLVSPVISQSVMDMYPVSSVVKSDFLSVKLDSGSSVDIFCSKFSQDATSEPDDPDEPTPTPTPVGDKVYWIVKGTPVFYGGNSTTIRYYCYVLDVVDFGIPVELSLQGNNALVATLINNSGLGTTWVNPVILHSTTKSEGAVYYFSATSVSNPTLYDLGTALVSTDFDFITSNYTPIPLVNQSGSSMASGINFRYLQSGQIYCFCPYIGKYPSADLLAYPPAIVGSEDLTSDSFFSTSSSTYGPGNPITLAYKYALNEEIEPEPDPYATPTPTPSPTPTEPPHVIITWPTSTPMPTPAIQWNPPGSKDTDLPGSETKSLFGYGLNWFRGQMNGGLLAKAFSFIPSDIQWLVWFLIFLLVILAVVRLLIHFGG